jgi:hypothetical protein
MFPNVYGFSWTPGYLIFLGIFFTVVLVILTTVLIALFRMNRAIKALKTDAIRWHSDFHDLPASDRACRHQLTGEFKRRDCEIGFECGHCATHSKWVAQHPVAAADDVEIAGMEFPADRMYHRGHTWLRQEEDGTVTVGLDQLGCRLFGRPDKVDFPTVGARLTTNGPGWTMRRSGVDVRVLSPVDGEVIETGGPDSGFYVKLKPMAERMETAHLLRGTEVRPWVTRELDRLQMLLAPAAVGTTLADGGVPVDDMPKAMPSADWDSVWGQMFLEP